MKEDFAISTTHPALYPAHEPRAKSASMLFPEHHSHVEYRSKVAEVCASGFSSRGARAWVGPESGRSGKRVSAITSKVPPKACSSGSFRPSVQL